ncbi:MAG: type I methionyl aminopeptidase, partial [Bacillota bacterium]
MVILRTPAEIEQMRRAGSLVGQVLERLREHVAPGVSTRELDAIAENMICSRGGVPSFKGYRGYPASICASVNNEIIHGIPGDRMLVDGDIISIDCGAMLGGYHGDAAMTFPVGDVSAEAEKLMTVTREALNAGIAMARPKMRLGDVGNAIQRYVEANGFSVVR